MFIFSNIFSISINYVISCRVWIFFKVVYAPFEKPAFSFRYPLLHFKTIMLKDIAISLSNEIFEISEDGMLKFTIIPYKNICVI